MGVLKGLWIDFAIGLEAQKGGDLGCRDPCIFT